MLFRSHASICACSAVGLLGLSASSVCGWAVAAPGTFAAHGTELVLGENVLSACSDRLKGRLTQHSCGEPINTGCSEPSKKEKISLARIPSGRTLCVPGRSPWVSSLLPAEICKGQTPSAMGEPTWLS